MYKSVNDKTPKIRWCFTLMPVSIMKWFSMWIVDEEKFRCAKAWNLRIGVGIFNIKKMLGFFI